MDLHIEARTKEEIAKVPLNRLWFKRETVDFPLTDEQYEIFKKGYAPDWDCRFAPVFMKGWFYITRSGYWLFKFKYEKNKKDGLWHITANYDTPFGSGFGFMLNVIHEGYFEPQIFGGSDIERYMAEMRSIVQVPRGVTEKPDNCEVCRSKLRPVIYRPSTSDEWAKIQNDRAIEGRDYWDENAADWECPKCGQGYKDILDEWNATMCEEDYGRKPKVCKRCGGPVLPVVYGFPDHKIQEKADNGEVILGGCCLESSEERDCECAWCHQGYKKFVPYWQREEFYE